MMTVLQLPPRIGALPVAGLDAALAGRPPVHRIDSPFVRDVLAGLSRPQKTIPCTWLYDRRGSELFEQITQLPEYYPTRTEISILRGCVGEIADAVGPDATLVELGSGSSRKTPMLLAALRQPRAYVPIDISVEYLADSIAALQASFPKLEIRPIVGDMRLVSTLPPLRRSAPAVDDAAGGRRPWGRQLGFFPGSTIGNFEPEAAVALLQRIGHALGEDSMLVIGVDSTMDRSLLLPAYDDRAGVTAAFNRNLLVRINRELLGKFNPMAFDHEARFNAQKRRMEMHLVCRNWEMFEVRGRQIVFEAGESIHTENSYKYSPGRFRSLARRAGWTPIRSWTAAHSDFGVHLLVRSPDRQPGRHSQGGIEVMDS